MNNPLLGLDIGFTRTGVALSESGMIAHPLGVLEAKPPHMGNVIDAVMQYIEEYSIQTIVVGIPYTQEDETTTQALRVEQVINQLQTTLRHNNLHPDIVTINEFHSTADARALYPDLDDNEAAATLILQDYIDSNPT